MQRLGSVIRLKPDKAEEYIRLHAAVWPEILALLSSAHIRNYSIFHRDGWLFSYLEYHGEDYAADMGRIAQEPVNQRWQAICKACHEPVEHRAPGEWWARMEEVFHMA
jgi:L-rhamnose mutarotase